MKALAQSELGGGGEWGVGEEQRSADLNLGEN